MLCDFANAFPTFVGKFLDHEWGLRRRLREETITDMWVASLVALNGLGLHVDLADEMETGADLEIWFLSSKRDRGVGFVIQAKRSHCGKVLMRPACELDWRRHRFEELDHAAGEKRRKGTQARDLTHAAERSGRDVYPLYAFYTPGHIFQKSGRIKGLMLADGHDVRRRIVLGRRDAWRRRTQPAGRSKPRRGSAEFKALERLDDLMFPLTSMFCFSSWASIRRVADPDDFEQSFMMFMRGQDIGVATVPEPEEVADSLAKMILRARGEPGVDGVPLPTVTRQVPSDILRLAAAVGEGGESTRPDIPVSGRRVVCVATSLTPEAPAVRREAPEAPHPDWRR
ncbi:DUF6615 family protein [Sphingomonas sp. GM_Shp_2]|uniref:DUF6615 family protein n=1 Tax=Sphingomonas sp. GM_Shp_2 TaxID=2937380 RepID=UPI00226ABC2E|nr:DUF6615 family protein [Sphingomonas sp. GM_Shp_2]